MSKLVVMAVTAWPAIILRCGRIWPHKAKGSDVQRTKGIGLVALLAFLIFAIPRANIKVGPVPLYFIDLVAAMILVRAVYLGRVMRTIRYPFRTIVAVMIFLCVVSELAAMIYGGAPTDALYLTGRFFLAHAIFLAIPLLVRNHGDIEIILKAVAAALLINAGLMILTSLPMTRRITMLTVFSIPQLEPASGQVLEDYLYTIDGDSGARGRTLVGVSIVGATYASIAWPLVAYLRSGDFRLSFVWRMISYVAILLAPMGIVLSYSRGALAGAVLIVLAALARPTKRLSRSILRPIVYSGVIIAMVGAGSSIFFFDRYINRFAIIIEEPFSDVRETDRLFSYIEPFGHLVKHPQFLVFGEGLALDRLGIGEQEGAANHSLFGAGYYARGMIWTLLFLFVIVSAARLLNQRRRAMRGQPGQDYPQALLLAYMPIFTLAAFAPGLANHPRSIMMYFLLLSFIVSLHVIRPFYRKRLTDEFSRSPSGVTRRAA
jgi:hypothetical protein